MVGVAILMSFGMYAEEPMTKSKLVEFLQSNEDPEAECIAYIYMDGYHISKKNEIEIPKVSSKKLIIENGLDTEFLNERLANLQPNQWNITFKAKEISKKRKVYSIINIKELESVASYKARLEKQEYLNNYFSEMVRIPGKNFYLAKTEVTQKLYEAVVGNNPSHFKNEDNPVESITWYEAIYFCNKLSILTGLNPVYSLSGTTDPDLWQKKLAPELLKTMLSADLNKNGYRLPVSEEWLFFADEFKFYEKSATASEYARREEFYLTSTWVRKNSEGKTHPVAQKKANSYGIYDMAGNVREMHWDLFPNVDDGGRVLYGSSYNEYRDFDDKWYHNLRNVYSDVGFRLACTATE